jgi:hypothetical protein
MNEEEEFQEIWEDVQQEFHAHTKQMMLEPINGRLVAARFIFYAALLNDFGLRDTIPAFLEIALQTKTTTVKAEKSKYTH